MTRLPASFFTIILMVICADTASGQTLRVVLAGDTQDATIGDGVKSNLSHLRSLLNSVKNDGGIPITITSLVDVDFSCAKISEVVKTLKWEKGDTVLFYYAGHGYRHQSDVSAYPEFDCQRGEDATEVGLDGVISLLDAKDDSGTISLPKLVIGIVDACNVVIDVPVPPPSTRKPASVEDRRSALRKLFFGYAGVLRLAAAKRGDYAWYVPSGGFFTTKVINIVQESLVSPTAARWPKIVSEAISPIDIPNNEHSVQYPVGTADEVHENTE